MAHIPSRLSGMRLLSTIINKDAHWKIKILNRWASIAGDFASHLVINRIEDATLFLEASHPMWAQEAQGSVDVFLERIAELCGPNRITKVLVRGCKTARTHRVPDSGKPEMTQRTLFPISNEAPSIELTQAERDALRAIPHKKLSSSMAEFYQQCKRRSLLMRHNPNEGGESYGTCNRSDCRCAHHRATNIKKSS